MLKDYKTRVSATYQLLRYSVDFINKDYLNLTQMNRRADLDCSDLKFRNEPYNLDYKISADCTIVEFKGNSYSIDKSELTGGNWHKYTKNAETFYLEYFDKHIPVYSTYLPEAYIIPPAWSEISDILQLHGVKIRTLKEPAVLNVQTIHFSDITFRPTPFEGHTQPDNFNSELITQLRYFPKGSVVVDMNQRTARIIAQALEPRAPGSFLKWGYFNTIFEQKEYSETYVMEGIARDMIAKNPDLKAEFEKRKAAGEFHESQWLMLNWFYLQSEYKDTEMNVYPVGFIQDRSETEKLVYEN
jgi:hypothetical protein